MIKNELVFVKKGEPVASSREISEKFGKQHKNVLRSIDNIDCPKEFSRLNFKLTKYNDSEGRIQREYLLTKDGFTYLVMGFRGKKASEFKIKYIKAFNDMHNLLLEKTTDDYTKMRLLGKEERKLFTETIKELQDFCLAKENKPYNTAYINYTKLINKTVGVDNKESANTKQLEHIKRLEEMAQTQLLKLIEKDLDKKEMYSKIKFKCDQYKEMYDLGE